MIDHLLPVASNLMRFKVLIRVTVIYLAVILFFPNAFGGQDLASHEAGIWSIADAPGMKRWIVIHDRDKARTTGIYHIEVIGRKDGDPAWQITRLVPHMAITDKALHESILEPLDTGAVYPEIFDDAYASWQMQNDGAGGSVCNRSVTQCMSSQVGAEQNEK
jgi:hypothetical protein